MRRPHRTRVVLPFLLAATSACGSSGPVDPPDPESVASVSVTPDLASIEVGGQVTYSATARDAAGNTLTGRVIAWSTADTDVATVSASGVVTGVGVGTTTVSATVEGVTGSGTVEVQPVPVASVQITPDSSLLDVGDTLTLAAATLDANAQPLTGRAVLWTSTDSGVATVDASTGLVTALTAGGTTVIATSEGVSDSAQIVVESPLPVGYTKVWRSDAASTDWSSALNWLPEGAPSAGDTIYIFAGANQPLLGANDSIAGLGQEVGSSVDVGAQTLFVAGDALADGSGITGSGTLELTGSGSVRGVVPRTIVRGGYTLAGTVDAASDLWVRNSGSLAVGGDSVAVAGDLMVIESGVLSMTDPAGVVDAAGSATFGGGNTDGLLTGGRLMVAGDFTQQVGVSLTPFTASDTHEVVFDGSATQTVTIQNAGSSGNTSRFADVEIAGVDVVFPNAVVVLGALSITSSATVSGAGPLRVEGDLSSVSGSTISVVDSELGGAMSVTGSFTPSTTEFFGTNQQIQAGLSYQDVAVTGSAELMGATAFTGGLTISDTGSLVVGAQSLSIAGDLSVTQSGLLAMTDPAGEIDLEGNASFSGGDSNGSLTAGTIRMAGNFTQDVGFDLSSFTASGTHRVIFDGVGPQTIDFNNAGLTGNSARFANLDMTGGDVVMPNPVVAVGDASLTVASTVSGAGPFTVAGDLTTVAGSTLSNATVELGATMTVAGTYSVATTEFFGPAQTIQPDLPYQDVIVTGSLALSGSTAFSGALTITEAGSLTVGSDTLTIAGNASVLESGVLAMTDPAGLVDLEGSVLFRGGDSNGSLTAGTLRVAGDFTQEVGFALTSFTASGTHLVQLDGALPQTVTIQNAGTTGDAARFQGLEVAGGDVSMPNDVAVAGTFDVSIGAAVFGAGILTVDGAFSTVSGSAITLSEVEVGSSIAASGTFSPATTEFFGTSQSIQSGLSYQDVIVTGTASLAGLTAATGDVIVNGSGNLTIGAQTLDVQGNLSVLESALLIMQDASGEVDVEGNVLFRGAGSEGSFSAGTLRVAGNFIEEIGFSLTSFTATGTHLVVLDGAATQTVDFENPGPAAGGSRFAELLVTGSDVNFVTDANVGGSMTLDGTMTLDATFTLTIAANLTFEAGSFLENNGFFDVGGTCTDNGVTVSGTGSGNASCVQP